MAMNAGELSLLLTADSSDLFVKLADAGRKAEAQAKSMAARISEAMSSAVIQPSLFGAHGAAGADSWRKQAKDATAGYDAKFGERFRSLAKDVGVLSVKMDAAAASAGSLGSSMQTTGEKSAQLALRVAKVGLAVGAVGHGMSVFAAVLRDSRTGGDDFLETMGRMPLGIGAVTRGFRELYNEVTGFNEAMERSSAAIASAEAMTAKAGAAKGAAIAHEDRMAMLEAEHAIESAATEEKKASLRWDKERLAIMLEYDKALRQSTTEAEREAAREEMAVRRAIVNEKELAETKKREAEADLEYGRKRAAAMAAESKARRDAASSARSVADAAKGTLQGELDRLRGVTGGDFIQSSQTAIGTFNLAAANAPKAIAENTAKQLAIQQAMLRIDQELLQLTRGGSGGFN